MILKAFRVQMYKCIIDSGWVEISPLTALIGKNESGKTAMLKALHKFNPYKPESYSPEREWPRGRRTERNNAQAVCIARFQLAEDEIKELSALADRRVSGNMIEVMRDYRGRLEILFPANIFPNKLHSNEIDAVYDSLPVVQEPAGDNFLNKANELVEKTRRLIYEGRFTELAEIGEAYFETLEAALTLRNPSIEYHNEQQFLTQYASKLKELSEKISVLPLNQRNVHEYIVKRLPTFIYMSDYSIFRGTAQLDQVKSRKDKNQLTDEDKTLLAIMDLTGLKLESEVRKGSLSDREQRQYDLDDASTRLTRAVSDRWKQRRYEIQFRADGQMFYTFVKDELGSCLVQLEERSKGFQWFFSFDLMLMHESEGNLKNCVILLDEPGLHLHPNAQADLLKRMEECAKENTLIYTTHLPFLIDVEKPERIHVLSEGARGSTITGDLMQSQPEAKFALETALGIKSSSGCLVARRNLVVESLDDFWILSELSRAMQRLGDEGLAEDIFITPAGGAAEAVYTTAFMTGHGLDVVVLLSSDREGYEAKERLVKKWLPRYGSNQAQVLTLDECLGMRGKELSIEDIFPEKFYADKVQEVYKKQLALLGHDKLDLSGSGSISGRVEHAFEKYGIKFDKYSVAKVIRSSLSRVQKAYEFPQETREPGRKLIARINAAFSREAQSDAANDRAANMVK